MVMYNPESVVAVVLSRHKPLQLITHGKLYEVSLHKGSKLKEVGRSSGGTEISAHLVFTHKGKSLCFQGVFRGGSAGSGWSHSFLHPRRKRTDGKL